MPRAARSRPVEPKPSGSIDAEVSDLTPILGGNLRRLRIRRGLSLERLARSSGVSRAMLSQIELGRSTPTINVVWRITRALELPFSALIGGQAAKSSSVLRAAEGKTLSSHDGRFTSRALFPYDSPRRVEFYELRFKAGALERAEPHAPGTTEYLAVSKGELEVEVEGARTALRAGDSIVFQADAPHAYANPGAIDTVAFLVMTYADSIG